MEPVNIASVEEYEELAASVEHAVQQNLQAHTYNTVGNFMRFYEEFKNSKGTSLRTFFRSYAPPITPEHYTCVGLGQELLKRLELISARFPKTAGKFYIVSCEESIDDLQGYIGGDPCVGSSEKEHVLVALKLLIEDRPGVLLLDPGYHVARVVTVMKDCIYPHTGWFTQSEESGVRKEYCYSFAENTDYVAWRELKTRKGEENLNESVIFVARPYITPVSVTERRNLVYNFRSWLARDKKGHLLAGIYFPVKENATLTIFFHDRATGKQRIQIPLSQDWQLTQDAAIALRRCTAHLGLRYDELQLVIQYLITILSDRPFIRDLLEINRDICGLSMEN